MPNRSRWSWLAGAVVAALAGVVGTPCAVGNDVLAGACFENDLPFSQAPLLSEPISDESSTGAGVSQVEVYSAGHRYRLNDIGTGGESRGIGLALSEPVLSGTILVSADLEAAQTDREGGEVSLNEEPEGKWCVRGGFGADGNMRLHGQATGFAYETGVTYRLTATVTIGENATTVDYRVVNLTDALDSYTLDDQVVEGPMAAAVLVFRTGFEDDGSWAVDQIEVARQ